jgi:pimeloyl-ACP methyl ester carboxylesterase
MEAETRSSDGVRIAYSVGGVGEPALLFIHGALVDRSIWREQLEPLAARHRVVALDLAGHGASGRDRKNWTMQSFGEDVRAVADVVGLRKVILIGSSMGGPIALEAAKLLPGRTVAVVGVDTLQDIANRPDASFFRAQAESFRKDFPKATSILAHRLFHPDADPNLVKDLEGRAQRGSPAVIVALMESFASYDTAHPAADAHVPVRCLNGDLMPTKVGSNRKIVSDFEVTIFPHTGHYPMLERPQQFNAELEKVVSKFVR